MLAGSAPGPAHQERCARPFARLGRIAGAPRLSVGTTPWSARVSTSLDPSAAQVVDHVQDAPEQVTRHGDLTAWVMTSQPFP